MRAPRVSPLLALATGLGLVGGVALAAEGFPHRAPDGFRAIDKVLALESGPRVELGSVSFDLAAGVALADCPQGAWSGTVSFLGHAGGTVEWTGQMLGCFPFGSGEARYPDGSRYSGTVASYLAPDADRVDATTARMAVREGEGSHTRADGKVVTGAFRRGTATDERDDPRLKTFEAALATLQASTTSGRLAPAALAAPAPKPSPTVAPAAFAAAEPAPTLAESPKPKKPKKEKKGFLERFTEGATGNLGNLQKAAQGGGLSGVATEAMAKKAVEKAAVDAAVATVVGEENAALMQDPTAAARAKLEGNAAGALAPAPAAPMAAAPKPTNPATAGGGGGGGGAGQCLRGVFQRPICGGAARAEVGFSGGANGTGWFQDADCAGVCPQGRRFEFRYTVQGDGSLRIEYTGGQICGQPTTPTGGVQPFSCNGANLRFGNDYTRAR